MFYMESSCEILEIAQPSRVRRYAFNLASTIFSSVKMKKPVNFSAFPISHFEMWTFIQNISYYGIRTE